MVAPEANLLDEGPIVPYAREVSGGELFRQMLRSAVSAQVFGGYVVHTYVLFSSLYWQLSSGKSAMSGRSDLQVCHRKLAAGPRRTEHVCATEMRVLLSRYDRISSTISVVWRAECIV